MMGAREELGVGVGLGSGEELWVGLGVGLGVRVVGCHQVNGEG